MNVFITGDKGFIAINLRNKFEEFGHNVYPNNEHFWNDFCVTEKNEPDVYRINSDVWAHYFKSNGIDVIIHNAAVVGTDVVALNQKESTLTNVMGTHNICRAARECKIPVCYIGTSVIYDTPKYQKEQITEKSDINPATFYGIQKFAGEQIVRTTVKDWMIIRPLFAYGGIGDMNSLIAKSFYAVKNGKKDVQMFLDPYKKKDYMHVIDFCDAVALACQHSLWGEDYNISAEEPLLTCDIVQMMSEICDFDIERLLQWKPSTDYLGNHLLSSKKFKKRLMWFPKHPFQIGLKKSWNEMNDDHFVGLNQKYNPLKHLEVAKNTNIDLTDFYPSV